MIIVDTGMWLALANTNDRWHKLAVERLENISEALITTWPVLTETCYFLLNQFGYGSLEKFLKLHQKGAFSTFVLSDAHAPRIQTLMKKYKDIPMDLADASLVITAEELGHGRILTTDRKDFQIYRWKDQHAFENILWS